MRVGRSSHAGNLTAFNHVLLCLTKDVAHCQGVQDEAALSC